MALTHDQWISDLNKYIAVAEIATPGTAQLVKALRAVIELHKPVMAWTGAYDYNDAELWAEQCDYCSGNGFSQMYPCRNIQAIEKELS